MGKQEIQFIWAFQITIPEIFETDRKKHEKSKCGKEILVLEHKLYKRS